MPNENHLSQKKYLSAKRKQLRVWVENEKYEKFKELVKQNDESIYALVNRMIDEYLEKNS
jgi:hypothetical protein